MFLKNKILKIFSYIFVLAGIALNLITIAMPTTGILLLDFTSWISALLFIGGITCIYANKNTKNKMVMNCVTEYLESLGQEYNIVNKQLQTDTFLVDIAGTLYNLLVIVSDNELVVMKQIAEQDTDFYVKKKDNSSNVVTKKFNYMWDSFTVE